MIIIPVDRERMRSPQNATVKYIHRWVFSYSSSECREKSKTPIVIKEAKICKIKNAFIQNIASPTNRRKNSPFQKRTLGEYCLRGFFIIILG